MTESKIRFSVSIRPDPDEAQLLFAKQLGIPCAYTWVSPEQTSVESLIRLRERVEAAREVQRVRYHGEHPDSTVSGGRHLTCNADMGPSGYTSSS